MSGDHAMGNHEWTQMDTNFGNLMHGELARREPPFLGDGRPSRTSPPGFVSLRVVQRRCHGTDERDAHAAGSRAGAGLHAPQRVDFWRP